MATKRSIATGGAMSGVPVTVATAGVIEAVGDSPASETSDLVTNMIADLAMILTEVGIAVIVERKTNSWVFGVATTATWGYVYRTLSAVWQPIDGNTIREEQGVEVKSVAMIQVVKTIDILADDRVRKSGTDKHFIVNYVKEFITHKTVYLKRTA